MSKKSLIDKTILELGDWILQHPEYLEKEPVERVEINLKQVLQLYQSKIIKIIDNLVLEELEYQRGLKYGKDLDDFTWKSQGRVQALENLKSKLQDNGE